MHTICLHNLSHVQTLCQLCLSLRLCANLSQNVHIHMYNMYKMSNPRELCLSYNMYNICLHNLSHVQTLCQLCLSLNYVQTWATIYIIFICIIRIRWATPRQLRLSLSHEQTWDIIYILNGVQKLQLKRGLNLIHDKYYKNAINHNKH